MATMLIDVRSLNDGDYVFAIVKDFGARSETRGMWKLNKYRVSRTCGVTFEPVTVVKVGKTRKVCREWADEHNIEIAWQESGRSQNFHW